MPTSSTDPETISVIGLPIAVTDYQAAIGWIKNAALKNDQAYAVEAANTHVAALARKNKDFCQAMAQFDYITPDGMPLVWSINRKLDASEKLKDRVYGPTLMLKTIEETEDQPEFRHFLLGGSEKTLDKLKKNFSERTPNATVAGSYSPPFGDWPEDEFERIRQKIVETRSNLVWIGLGCPKQELWIAENKDRLPPAVYFGIGAAFAFHAGEVKQAPAYVQRLGCEWLYRLCKEPRRLFKRYLVNNSLFIWYSLLDTMRTKDA